MKKLFSVLIIAVALLSFSVETNAQITKLLPTTTANSGTISSTLTGADTAYVTLEMLPEMQSVTVYDTKVSGTVGGTWYLVGSVQGTGFRDKLDSLTRVDGNGHKTFILPIPTQRGYAKYELIGYQSGTNPISTIKVYSVRRSSQ